MKLLIALCRIFVATALVSACSFNAASDTGQGLSTTSVTQTKIAEVKLVEVKVTDVKVTELRVLLFTKTAGYRHKSIAAGRAAIKNLAQSNGFTLVSSQNATLFSDEKLQQFNAIIFLNTTGNILTAEQQASFERYIQSGGGYVGIHAATDTEPNWPWYGKLVGAYFASHPKPQAAIMMVNDNGHQSTAHLSSQWQRYDEWYNFKALNPKVNILISLDETSYQGGKNGKHHPIAWYHEYDGGRAFYTGGGHSKKSYAEPEFLQHLLGGILYSAGYSAGARFKDKQLTNERFSNKQALEK